MMNNARLVLMLFAFFGVLVLAQPDEITACPLTPEQIEAVWGVVVTEIQPNDSLQATGMTLEDCRYTIKTDKREFTLRLEQTIYSTPVTAEQHYGPLAGNMVKLPDDPDHAMFQVGQGDLSDPALHYFRNSVAVHLRILGVYYEGFEGPSPEEFQNWQQKLLALPRVP